ncbi:class F sortase [Actinoplanes nipponensis]|nr:class F sortase [Actinoplanes nipponensis]
MPQSVLRRRPAEILAARPHGQPQPAAPPARRPSPRPPARIATAPARTRPPAARATTGRRPLPLGLMAAILVFVGLFTVGAGLGAATGFNLGDLFRGPDKPPPRAFPVLDPSTPKRLTIRSIKVEAPILRVGRAADGSVDVPPLTRHNEAGWFDQGPTPGQFGPALIVGHADTRTGPSVFAGLGKLKAGQKIEVLREDDSVAIFQINSVEHFNKEKLPVKRVYGDYSRPSLRLMTCGGRWLGGKRGYSDNVVVFASLVSAKET